MKVVSRIVFGDVLPAWKPRGDFDVYREFESDVGFSPLERTRGAHILYDLPTATDLVSYDNDYDDVVPLPTSMDIDTRIYLQQCVDLLRKHGEFEKEFKFNPRWMIYNRFE